MAIRDHVIPFGCHLWSEKYNQNSKIEDFILAFEQEAISLVINLLNRCCSTIVLALIELINIIHTIGTHNVQDLKACLHQSWQQIDCVRLSKSCQQKVALIKIVVTSGRFLVEN